MTADVSQYDLLKNLPNTTTSYATHTAVCAPVTAPDRVGAGEGLPPAAATVGKLDHQRLGRAGQRATVEQRDDLVTLLPTFHSKVNTFQCLMSIPVLWQLNNKGHACPRLLKVIEGQGVYLTTKA